jgi:chemotaxis protein methyltransferase CheR
MKRETSVEDVEIELLLEGVFQRFDIDFRGYERAPLKRKLHHLMHEIGAPTVSALQNQVMHDAATGDALLRALGAKPKSALSDPEYVRSLRVVLGTYLSSYPAPRIWIAECTDAHEACMLSILLDEEKLDGHAHIFATCANEAIVSHAQKGKLCAHKFREYEECYRLAGSTGSLADHYVRENDTIVFGPAVQRRITWAQFHLATDTTFNEFQLIICHGALSDCGIFLKKHVLNLFHESLSRFGILSVDGVAEIETAPFSTQFRKLPLAGEWYKHAA